MGKMIEILPEMEIVDLALWLKKEKVLIVSDFHLGYEESLKNLLMPKFQLKDVLIRLSRIIQKAKPQKIIINGDLKQEYGHALFSGKRDILKLLDFLGSHCQQLILVKGNHDLFLGSVVNKQKVLVVEDYLISGIFICHGDKIRKTTAKTIIIGHEHPAITLKEGIKKEKYKCFLKAKMNNKNIIVQPSFNLLLEGTDILTEKLLSPYLTEINHFEVFIVGENQIYSFGKVQKQLN